MLCTVLCSAEAAWEPSCCSALLIRFICLTKWTCIALAAMVGIFFKRTNKQKKEKETCNWPTAPHRTAAEPRKAIVKLCKGVLPAETARHGLQDTDLSLGSHSRQWSLCPSWLWPEMTCLGGQPRIVQSVLRQEPTCRWTQCSRNEPPAAFSRSGGAVVQLTAPRSHGNDSPGSTQLQSLESCDVAAQRFKWDVVSLKIWGKK